MTSPAQLDEAAADPAPTRVVGDRITDEQHNDTIAELAPGDSAPFSFNVPRRLLQADTPGVYWFGVHALGEGPDGRDDPADGRARTFLPLVPPAREGQHADRGGDPAAPPARLHRRRLGRRPRRVDADPLARAAGSARWSTSAPAPATARVTWVVDPALVDAVRRLAAGNPPRSLAPNLQAGQDDGEDERRTRPVHASPTERAE